MPEVVIIAKDGTEHVFPDGFNPKKAALIVRGAPSNSVIPEQSGAKLPFGLDTFLNQAESTNEDPGGTLAMLASTAAVGPAISAVGKVVPAAARAAASPVGQGVIGAAMGGYTGGVPGAIAGGMAGATGGYFGRSKVVELLNRMGLGKPDVVAKGMSEAGDAASHALANQKFDAILAKRQAANPAAWADAPTAAPVAKAAQPATRQALESEVENRITAFRGAKSSNQELNGPAWFTTDIDEANAYSSAANPTAKLFGAKAKAPDVKVGAQVQPVELAISKPKQVSFAEAANATPETLNRAASEGFDAISYTDGKKTWYVPVDNKSVSPKFGLGKDAPKPTWSVQGNQAPTRANLENEIGKRIDWRTTDAVPIDAIKRDVSRGGSIIEAGESQIGLAERLAQLMKNPNPVAIQEATELAKALRQRGHITRGMK